MEAEQHVEGSCFRAKLTKMYHLFPTAHQITTSLPSAGKGGCGCQCCPRYAPAPPCTESRAPTPSCGCCGKLSDTEMIMLMSLVDEEESEAGTHATNVFALSSACVISWFLVPVVTSLSCGFITPCPCHFPPFVSPPYLFVLRVSLPAPHPVISISIP